MYEVGVKVNWFINKFKMVGCILEYKGESVSIMCHLRGSMPCTQIIEVKKELLTIE